MFAVLQFVLPRTSWTIALLTKSSKFPTSERRNRLTLSLHGQALLGRHDKAACPKPRISCAMNLLHSVEQTFDVNDRHISHWPSLVLETRNYVKPHLCYTPLTVCPAICRVCFCWRFAIARLQIEFFGQYYSCELLGRCDQDGGRPSKVMDYLTCS